MILVDANLLIYAVNADSPPHPAARKWLEDTLSGTTRLGLSLVAFPESSLSSGPGLIGYDFANTLDDA